MIMLVVWIIKLIFRLSLHSCGFRFLGSSTKKNGLWRNRMFLSGADGSRKSKKMCILAQKWSTKNRNNRCKCELCANYDARRLLGGGVWHCIQRINVRQFLTENSGMRKMFSKIVTRILIEKEKQRQLHYSFDLSNIAVILAGSLPGAESRCFQYEPENKTFAVENKEVFSVETKSAHVARSSWLCLCIFCL